MAELDKRELLDKLWDACKWSTVETDRWKACHTGALPAEIYLYHMGRFKMFATEVLDKYFVEKLVES